MKRFRETLLFATFLITSIAPLSAWSLTCTSSDKNDLRSCIDEGIGICGRSIAQCRTEYVALSVTQLTDNIRRSCCSVRPSLREICKRGYLHRYRLVNRYFYRTLSSSVRAITCSTTPTPSPVATPSATAVPATPTAGPVTTATPAATATVAETATPTSAPTVTVTNTPV